LLFGVVEHLPLPLDFSQSLVQLLVHSQLGIGQVGQFNLLLGERLVELSDLDEAVTEFVLEVLEAFLNTLPFALDLLGLGFYLLVHSHLVLQVPLQIFGHLLQLKVLLLALTEVALQLPQPLHQLLVHHLQRRLLSRHVVLLVLLVGFQVNKSVVELLILDT